MLPFVLGLGILWWMYRGTNWSDFGHYVLHEMNWWWMLLSLAFGILPQMARAWRWKMALEPLGDTHDALHVSMLSLCPTPQVLLSHA